MGSGASAEANDAIRKSSVEELQGAVKLLDPRTLETLRTRIGDTNAKGEQASASYWILRCPRCKRTMPLPESGAAREKCCKVCYLVPGEEEAVLESTAFCNLDVNHVFTGETKCSVSASPSTPVIEVKQQIGTRTGIEVPMIRLLADSLEVTDAAVLPDSVFAAGMVSYIVQEDPRWSAAKTAAEKLDAEVASLEDGSGSVKKVEECLSALGALEGGAKLQVDSVLRLLNQESRAFGPCIKSAANTLLAMGTKFAAPHIATLIHHIQKHPEAVSDCIIKLGLAGVPCAPEVAAYLEESRDPEAACYILKSLGANLAQPYVSKIAPLLENSSVHIQKQAFELLLDLDASTELSRALASKYPEMRQIACEGIAGLGPGAVATFSDKIALLLQDKVATVRSAACVALGSLPGEAVTLHASIIAEFLHREKSPDVRIAAFQSLVSLKAAEQLATFLGHKDPDLRGRACMSLGLLGEPALLYISAIQGLQKDDAETNVAIVGVTCVGAAAKAAMQDLDRAPQLTSRSWSISDPHHAMVTTQVH